MDGKLTWLETSGGPIVMSAHSQARSWRGIDGPDYDAACEVFDLTGVVSPDKHGDFLVLGDEPFRTTVVKDASGNDQIVRWCAADNENSLLSAVLGFDFEAGEPIESLTWNALETKCVLFDSSQPLAEVDQKLELVLPQARVLVRTWDIKPDPSTNAIVHRFSADNKE